MYVINLDEYKSIGTHWIAFYDNTDNVTALEWNVFQKTIKKFIDNKNITTNIYRIQASD